MKLFLLSFLFIISTAFGQQKIDDLTSKKITVNGKIEVNSTTQASRPCPSMTEAQRNAIVSPTESACIYNSSTKALNVWNGSAWGSVGGGLSLWVTAQSYAVGDVVIESNKIYRCLVAHTSGTFATDLASGDWVELSKGMTTTGSVTDNAITRYDGTTGNLVQGSLASVDDSGNVSANDYAFTDSNFNTVSLKNYIAVIGSTGVIDGCVLAIGSPTTTASISSCTVAFDVNVSGSSYKRLVIAANNNFALTFLNTNLVTYVGYNSSGVLVQQTTPFTNAQRRTIAQLGAIVHTNLSTVNAVNQTQDVIISTSSQLKDFMQNIGVFNVGDGNVFSANGANLQLNKSAGVMQRVGSNWDVDQLNPNAKSLAALTGLTFQYRFQNGTSGSNTTSINPDIWDVGGTSTAVNNNKFTVQRIYLFSSNLVRIQPGQTEYNNMADAIAAIQTQSFVTEANIKESGLLRGFLVVRKGTTSLLNTSDAFFLQAGMFGGASGVGGLSTTTLQGAYNNSPPPQIITNSTNGGIEIRRGSGADTDAILKGQNGAGTNTLTIAGNGEVKSENKISSDNLFRNQNILINPSFEQSTYNNGWGCTTGTMSDDTTNFTDGAHGLGVNSSGAGTRCYQLVTANAANLKGLLAYAGMKIKTTDTIYKVCALVDGSTTAQEKNCVNIPATTSNRPFFDARLYFEMGGTSNGIVFYTTTTTSQPTTIDEAFVSPTSLNPSLINIYNATADTAVSPVLTGGSSFNNEGTYCRREGRYLVCTATGVINTPNSTAFTFQLPDGLKIDPLISPTASDTNALEGYLYRLHTTASSTYPTTTSGPWVPFANISDNDSLVYFARSQNGSRFLKAPANDLFLNGERFRLSFRAPIANWAPYSNGIALQTQQISSDTLAFVFKSTAITATDPVGTFNTYKKVANSQLGATTLITTAPIQTVASMNSNGVFLTCLGYAAAGSDGSPQRFDIKIGRGIKAWNQIIGYNTTGKPSGASVQLDMMPYGTAELYGLNKMYNEESGILTLDCGNITTTSITTRGFLNVGGGAGSSTGYFVFNTGVIPAISSFPIVGNMLVRGLTDNQVAHHYNIAFGNSSQDTACTNTTACPYIRQKGGASIKYAALTGRYTMTFPLTYSQIYCYGTGYSSGVAATYMTAEGGYAENANFVNLFFRSTSAGTLQDSGGIVNCDAYL